MQKRINYRKLAFATYAPICAHCGFGIPEVLEVGPIAYAYTDTPDVKASFDGVDFAPVRGEDDCRVD